MAPEGAVIQSSLLPFSRVRGRSKWFQFLSLELLLQILRSRGEGGHKYPTDPILPRAPLAILGAVQG